MAGLLARLPPHLAAQAQTLPDRIAAEVDRNGDGRLSNTIWKEMSGAERGIAIQIRRYLTDGFDAVQAAANAVELPTAAQGGQHLVGSDPLTAVTPPSKPDPKTGLDPQAMHTLFGHAVNTDGLEHFEGAALVNELRSRFYAGHVTLDYLVARQKMFGIVDNQNGTVKDVYTGKTLSHSGEVVPDANGANGMNTEHTWPQSELKKQNASAAVSDLHHLFPANTHANGERSNYPFGTPVRVTWSEAGSKLGTDAKGRTVFEPPAEHRGNVARALFWISAAYNLPIEPDEEAVLKRWNVEDPVDDAERSRNFAVQSIQGDLNPFVIDSGLANRIADF